MVAEAAWHSPGLIPLILIGAGAVLAYSLLVLAKPLVICPRCLGKRMLRPPRRKPPRSKSARKRARKRIRRRARKCWLCHAKGVYRMPGATVIHRFFWSLAGDHIRDKRREAVQARADARREG